MSAARSRTGGAAPGSFNDHASARIVWRIARDQAEPEDGVYTRLPRRWKDAALVSLQEGPKGLQRWFLSERERLERLGDRDQIATIQAALKAAEEGAEDEDDDPDTIPLPRKFDLGIAGTSEFAKRAYPRDWRIKGIAVKGRPGIIGGPQKALKTSTVLDMVVSLASATPFLDEFEVPRPTRVLLISGESGEAVIQETMRRVCRAKGIEPEELDGFAHWGFTLPQLSDPDQLTALADYVRTNGIEVVIIDPLYLCLIGIGRRIDPSNLFDVGPLLKTITQTILDAGADPWLVHHFRKNRESPNGPPEMEDLAFAGIQEFARQWILLGRREKYEPGSGEHRLWISVGGSDGHSGEWALDVSEGTVGEDFSDRQWNVSVTRAGEMRAEVREQAQQAKVEQQIERARQREEAKERKRHDDAEAVLAKLKQAGPSTKSAIRDRLAWDSARSGAALALLLEQGRIGIGDVTVTGSGGRQWKTPGYHHVSDSLRRHSEVNPGEPRRTTENHGDSANPPRLDPGSSNPGGEGGFIPVGDNPLSPELGCGSKGDDSGDGISETRRRKNPPGLHDGEDRSPDDDREGGKGVA